MIQYPPRLQLANLPTPITQLKPGFAGIEHVGIWVKRDETTGTEVSGNKIRKLEFCLAEARETGCNTVITCGGVQSNHCRATAILGKRLGFKVHLLLRGEKPAQPEGNLLLGYLAGAEISYLPAREWRNHKLVAEDIRSACEKKGDKALFIPTGASNEVGLWGYIAACEELQQDFQRLNMTPDYIVVATGSGGTQGGLLAGSQMLGLPGKVVAFAVCDDARYFHDKVIEDVTLWKQRYNLDFDESTLDIRTNDDYIGPGYGEAGPEVFKTIKALAAAEGLFLDPVYTGKAFHGMVSELKKGSQGALAGARNVLFVHTGGLFGVFPQQGQFQFD